VTHNLTSNSNKFKTSDLDPNQSGTFTAPTQPGTYSYNCTIHPFMTGSITVS
jgi:plastocyanin